MADRDAVRALTQFTGSLTAGLPAAAVVHDLLTRVTDVLAVDSSGVTRCEQDAFRPVDAVGPAAAAAQQAQADVGQGPCLDVLRDGRPVLCSDLRAEPGRWPAFSARAREIGIVAVAGLPMRLGSSTPASLGLYSAASRDWTEHDVAVAQALADIASSHIAHDDELTQARDTVRQLQEALESRIVIEQAKGMIAAERSIPVEEAFGLIRVHARSHRVGLREVSYAIVHLGLRP